MTILTSYALSFRTPNKKEGTIFHPINSYSLKPPQSLITVVE